MEAYIQNIGKSECYTRLGKVIPNREEKVDIVSYFGSGIKEEEIIRRLLSDRNIKCNVVKPAGDTARNAVKEIEKETKTVQKPKGNTKNLRK